MKISATIGFNEFDFEIVPPNEGNSLWVGNRIGDNSEEDYLTFKLDNGVISELKVNKEIDTEKGILIERLLNVLRDYYETHQMGFEAEEVPLKVVEEKKPYDPEQIRVRPMVLSSFQVHRDIQKRED